MLQNIIKKYIFTFAVCIVLVLFEFSDNVLNKNNPSWLYLWLNIAWNVLPFLLLESFSKPLWGRVFYKSVAALGFIWEMLLFHGVYFDNSQGDGALGFIFTPIYIGGFGLLLLVMLNIIHIYKTD